MERSWGSSRDGAPTIGSSPSLTLIESSTIFSTRGTLKILDCFIAMKVGEGKFLRGVCL